MQRLLSSEPYRRMSTLGQKETLEEHGYNTDQ